MKFKISFIHIFSLKFGMKVVDSVDGTLFFEISTKVGI